MGDHRAMEPTVMTLRSALQTSRVTVVANNRIMCNAALKLLLVLETVRITYLPGKFLAVVGAWCNAASGGTRGTEGASLSR